MNFVCVQMKRRGNISLKLIADMCVKAGFDHLLTVDLHSKESQGFFSCRMDNLRAAPFFLQYVIENIPDYHNAVIIARNPLGARRATSFADRLKVGRLLLCLLKILDFELMDDWLQVNIAVLHGEYKDEADEREEEDGRASPPPGPQLPDPAVPAADRTRVFSIGPPLPPGIEKEKPQLYLVGEVAGKVAIMVDDIMDDVHSFVKAAQVLKENGASKVYCMATHGILSKEAPVLIQQSAIDEVVVTNSVPHDTQKAKTNKIKTVDISILLAEAIRRIHNKESMSHLFRNVTMED